MKVECESVRGIGEVGRRGGLCLPRDGTMDNGKWEMGNGKGEKEKGKKKIGKKMEKKWKVTGSV